MEFEKAIQELKGHIQDYAEEILTKSKGKDQYECIFCGSGTGSSGTGALTIYQRNRGIDDISGFVLLLFLSEIGRYIRFDTAG